MKLTKVKICKEIKFKFNIDVELVTGDGYFYFCSPDGTPLNEDLVNWYSTTVYVFRLNHLTLDQWLDKFEGLMEDKDSCV